MKIYKISYLVFFFTFLNYGQNHFEGKIHYKKKIEITIDSMDMTSENLDHIKRTEELSKELNKLNYYLLIKKNESLFEIDDKLELDGQKKFNLGKLIGGGKGIYYTNLTNNIVIHQKESFGKLFLIKQKITDVKWELTNKVRKINGFICYKATSEIDINTRDGLKKEKIIAWYAPKINADFGPIGFSGLPGLILELKKGKFIFYASNVISNNSISKIKRPKDGLEVSKKEFDKLSKELFDNRGSLK